MASHLRGQLFFWMDDIRGMVVQFSFDPFFVRHEPADDYPIWRSQFYYRESPNGTNFGCPYWFAVLIVAVVASILWTKNYPRFSLRTLLIAMTLVAVALGVIIAAK
jgi:hypothetical protein